MGLSSRDAARPLMVGAWALGCPRCRAPLARAGELEASCTGCRERYRSDGAVWDLLLPADAATLSQFLSEYTHVRRSEGRAMTRVQLRSLPYTDAGHPRPWEWRVRRASYEALLNCALSGRASRAVADLGAGTGWLSHRLVGLGHRPVAVDISTDALDGLGAAAAFDEPGAGPLFPRIRATFRRLPLADASADAVVFNASFHYAPEPEATLLEAVRVLRRDGVIVLMDSPFYERDAMGEAMLAERRAKFSAAYGFNSDSHGGREYLTWARLAELGSQAGISWRLTSPWRGVRFAMRPWWARVRRRRPPARFPLAVGRRVRGPAGPAAGPEAS